MQKKLIERYLKVKALAEAGSGGERTAARDILRKLEGKNPGLKAAAEASEREAARSPFPSSPPAPGQSPSRRGGNWENLFRFTQWAWQEASNLADQVAEAAHGRMLAERVEFSARTRQQVLYITLRLPFSLVGEVQEMNVVQKETFRQEIHEKLDKYIDALLKE